MVCIGYQGDYDVVFGYRVFQSGRIIDVEADGLSIGKVAGELLGRGQRTAGDGDVHAGVGEDLDGRRGNKTGAEEKGGLRHPYCEGRCTWRIAQRLSWYRREMLRISDEFEELLSAPVAVILASHIL